jgi:hypothetical protein
VAQVLEQKCLANVEAQFKPQYCHTHKKKKKKEKERERERLKFWLGMAIVKANDKGLPRFNKGLNENVMWGGAGDMELDSTQQGMGEQRLRSEQGETNKLQRMHLVP